MKFTYTVVLAFILCMIVSSKGRNHMKKRQGKRMSMEDFISNCEKFFVIYEKNLPIIEKHLREDNISESERIKYESMIVQMEQKETECRDVVKKGREYLTIRATLPQSEKIANEALAKAKQFHKEATEAKLKTQQKKGFFSRLFKKN